MEGNFKKFHHFSYTNTLSLTTASLDHFKSAAIKDRLQKINPFIQVKEICKGVSNNFDFKILNQFDIVFDFTASDEVLFNIEKTKDILDSKKFFSFSFGIKANPVICYHSPLNQVSLKYFNQELVEYKEAFPESITVNESIGCWSPVFPATYFSIQNASHICFQFFYYCLSNIKKQYISVYKSDFDGEEFVGVKRVK